MDDYPQACADQSSDATFWTCYDGNTEDGEAIAVGTVHQCGEYDPINQIFEQHGNCEDVGAAAFICTCEPAGRTPTAT